MKILTVAFHCCVSALCLAAVSHRVVSLLCLAVARPFLFLAIVFRRFVSLLCVVVGCHRWVSPLRVSVASHPSASRSFLTALPHRCVSSLCFLAVCHRFVSALYLITEVGKRGCTIRGHNNFIRHVLRATSADDSFQKNKTVCYRGLNDRCAAPRLKNSETLANHRPQ